jgi:hypothetical protein
VTPVTFRLLDDITDSFNPLLALVGLAAPWFRRPRTMRSTGVYYLSAGAAIGIVYIIRWVDVRHQIWALAGLDFSTHSAFAASLVTSLGVFHRRWLGPLLILIVLYFCLQLIMRYHSTLDIVSSTSVAVVFSLLLNFVVTWAFRTPVQGSRSSV